MKMVLVHWLDASAGNSWTHVSEIEPHSKLTHTLGFLVEETKEVLILASTYDHESHSVIGIMQIPKGMVKKREILCQHIKIKKPKKSATPKK